MLTLHAFAQNVDNFSGHPYTYHLNCQMAVQNLGLDYCAYVPLNCPIASLPSKWRKWLPSPSDKSFFKRQVRRLVRCARGEPRIFFIETFTRRELRTFTLSTLKYANRTDYVWILFRDDHIMKRPRDHRAVRLWIRLLKLKFGPHLHLLTDSTAIADFLNQETGHDFTVLPLPQVELNEPASFEPPATRRLLFIGQPRKEKGLATIQKIVQSEDEARSRFELTCSEEIQFDVSSIILHAHPAQIENDLYQQMIREHDVILLPYSAERYGRRTSGIFVEAICLGTIPLVTNNTWMSNELRKYGLEELIIDFDEPNFFTRIDRLLNNQSIYPKLQKMQARYRQYHNLETFQGKLGGLLSPSSQDWDTVLSPLATSGVN